MAQAFKFIHAADFDLDQPIRGIPDLPVQLKQALVNAPYDAAARVFQVALSERVDFVLLSGDLFDWSSSGPRPVAFLLNQFEQLAEKGIEIYWCRPQADPVDSWPQNIELPDNVTTFNGSAVEVAVHRRKGTVIARIYGSGCDLSRISAEDLAPGAETDVYMIALGHGDLENRPMPFDEFQYWALGGSRQSSRLEKPESLVVYPGTIQGRSPTEPGPHGCFLCRVDENAKLRTQLMETDMVRWLDQTVAIHESASETELKSLLSERATRIALESTERVALVAWHLATTGEFNPFLRHREFCEGILDWLREEFGGKDNGIWSTRLTIQSPRNLPDCWSEEDTILGEYLRAVDRYQSDDSLNISLQDYFSVASDHPELDVMSRVAVERRDETLRLAVLEGIEYLAADNEGIESLYETAANNKTND